MLVLCIKVMDLSEDGFFSMMGEDGEVRDDLKLTDICNPNTPEAIRDLLKNAEEANERVMVGFSGAVFMLKWITTLSATFYNVYIHYNFPPADLWRHAVGRGHRRAMLQPLPAKHYQRQWQYRRILPFWEHSDSVPLWLLIKQIIQFGKISLDLVFHSFYSIAANERKQFHLRHTRACETKTETKLPNQLWNGIVLGSFAIL